MLLKPMLPTKPFTKQEFVSIIFSTSSSERLKLIQKVFCFLFGGGGGGGCFQPF